ncbi:winged helix-turn-helix domain-containing protein [Occallatibacter riparius]|uniref:Winged helix-turn-helix domain-containing protein n=1 Tax=Occallatibacter riparius TaxID=1002689 RepID=A0A9J7BU88_9BACT|nr:winged helix-turn-helix domain-containing protein [Occallatibacter riparius]UWZ85298.1 winged helix-turn-helix domain-containing protein [Occallatibacter riparius]
MESPVHPPTNRLHFRAFEFDMRTRELFRNGSRLKLHGHPIDVLLMLLERPGELVTREELRKKLWPEDTFVDFEHGLNSTIRRLRDALGDNAEHARYIETLPRLGYRFISEIEADGSAGDGTRRAQPNSDVGVSTLLGAAAKDKSEGPVLVHTAERTRSSRFPWLVAAGSIVALAIVTVWLVAFWRAVPHVTSIDAITNGTNGGRPTAMLASDGTRVYYNEIVNDRVVLMQTSPGGGEPSKMQTPLLAPGLLDIAPDRSSLLLVDWGASSSLWIDPLPQGPPRRVGDVSADDATFTPDGSQIVFTKGADVWICYTDGSQARKLWTAPGTPGGSSALRVSPDGQRLRLSACETSGCAVWEAKTDGSGAHRVLPRWLDRTRQDGGVWSPDGRFYVFGAVTWKGAFHENLWVMRERRGGWFSSSHAAPVQLTGGPMCFASRVAFSPDGKTLFAFGMKDDSQLVRYDPVTNKVEPFVSGVPAESMEFSRDGQWVVYVTTPYSSLWRSRSDGSERVQLTSSDDSSAGIARWSPDGTRIAFEWTRPGELTKIAVISRDGGSPEQVVPDKEDSHEQADPTWSPDGKEIIFARDRGSAELELLRVDLQTRKVRPVPGSSRLFSPRWSPDGRYLAAFTFDMHSIRLFDFQKQVWTTWFTAQEDTVGWNLWSPDGSALYFLRSQTKDPPLAWWRITLKGQMPKKVMDLPRERILDASLTLGPDGKAYYTRDLNSYGIYAIHLSER